MVDLGQLLLARHLFKNGRPGDAVVVKAEALGRRPSPQLAALLEPLRGPPVPVDLAALGRLPAGSLGAEYARHMEANRLQPLEITARLDPELVRRNVFAVRYAVTHDVFHVLLGFDTSWSGELGVLAFNVAQGQGPVGPLGLGLALLVYTLASPLRVLRTVRSLWQGWQIGRRARPSLLVERFETHWAEPLEQVRRELDLPVRSPA